MLFFKYYYMIIFMYLLENEIILFLNKKVIYNSKKVIYNSNKNS